MVDDFTAILRIISGVNFKVDNILQCKDDKQKNYFILRNKTDSWDGKEATTTNNYLYSFHEVIDSIQIEKLFEKFFKINDQFYQDIILLSSCIGNFDIPKHYKFLNLMYVLDRVCSKKPKNTYEKGTLSRNDIRHIEILRQKQVPSNTINYLESKLTKTNFGKLKERLNLFLKSKSFIIELNTEERLEHFIELTVNTRNHLAHGTIKEPNLEIDQMNHVNEILINWISLIILEELGMPSDRLLSKSRIY